MELIDKARIIADFWMDYRNDPNYDEFMQYHDLGLPLSFGISDGFIQELSPRGEALVQETYVALCVIAGADPEASFDDPSDFYDNYL